MPANSSSSRRRFLKKLAATSALASGAVPTAWAAETEERLEANYPVSANERVRIASIGMGIIGFANVETALEIPGVELVAAADCYDARLERTKELYGPDVFTSRNYEDLLARDDVDAVFINTPDHWHTRIAIDALRAGKPVRVEKPMVQKIEEGAGIIQAEQETGGIVQVGSQGISSVVTEKARDLLASGAIGTLNMVESWVSRNSAMGAWQYSIPPDASPATIDWDRFVGHAPKRAFDADRFFRWRKYWDYGTGIAGDMFVHRFTKFHRIVNSTGPVRATSVGQLSHWNDGRDVPDVLVCLYEYAATAHHPAFVLVLKSNLADASGGGPEFTFIGNEGSMVIQGESVTVSRRGRQPEPSEASIVRGYNSVRTFSTAEQEAFVEAYRRYRPSTPRARLDDLGSETTFSAPDGYSAGWVHMVKFINAVRAGSGKSLIENATYGLRAAAPSLLANLSYLDNRPYAWNPETMTLADNR